MRFRYAMICLLVAGCATRREPVTFPPVPVSIIPKAPTYRSIEAFVVVPQKRYYLTWGFPYDWRDDAGNLPIFRVYGASDVRDVTSHLIATLDGTNRIWAYNPTGAMMFYAVSAVDLVTGNESFAQ